MDKAVIDALCARNATLATAESCTGGLLGKRLTDVPGASRVYLGGVVSYAYAVKQELLGVDAALLQTQGAVCSEVARQMAEGVRALLHADFALAVTGNAGPGADEKNPRVGECFVACARAGETSVRKLTLDGSRAENREACCDAALTLLLQMITGQPKG